MSKSKSKAKAKTPPKNQASSGSKPTRRKPLVRAAAAPAAEAGPVSGAMEAIPEPAPAAESSSPSPAPCPPTTEPEVLSKPGKAEAPPRKGRARKPQNKPGDTPESSFEVRTPRAPAAAHLKQDLLPEPEPRPSAAPKKRPQAEIPPKPSLAATAVQPELSLELPDPVPQENEAVLDTLAAGAESPSLTVLKDASEEREPVLTEPAYLQGRLFDTSLTALARSRPLPETPEDFTAPPRLNLPVRLLLILLGSVTLVTVIFMAGMEIQRLLDNSAQHQRDLIFRDRRGLETIAAP